jgi:DNA mismatch repair protein MutS
MPTEALFSLLYPGNGPQATRADEIRLDPEVVRDLDIEKFLSLIMASRSYPIDKRHREKLKRVFLSPCLDPATIKYRQDTIDDLLAYLSLVACFDRILPRIETLRMVTDSRSVLKLYEVTTRIGDLNNYVDCVALLEEAFGKIEGELRSAGLRYLREWASATAGSETFRNLARELPGLMSRLQGIASVTLGVNLDTQLRPVAATILSINDARFTEKSNTLLNRILGKAASEFSGITPLQTAYGDDPGLFDNPRFNPLMLPLFKDMADVIEKTTAPVAKALERYRLVNTFVLAELSTELLFYLGAVDIIRRVRESGLSMCKPCILPIEDRTCRVKNAFNLNLALRVIEESSGPGEAHAVIVPNDIGIGDEGRIVILTGPNRGGKTTYLRSIALVQLLFQLGLYVPGEEAGISPVDGIFTHFPAEEPPDNELGRFGDEANRLAEVFTKATRHSFIFLNESLTSTAVGESLYIAEDIVKIMRFMGARAVYATHMHELAVKAELLNREPGSSKIVSMVSLVEEETTAEGTVGRRTFKIAPGQPAGHSYALEIARKHGISYDQLMDKLKARESAERRG